MRKNRRLGVESLETRIVLAAGPFHEPALFESHGGVYRSDRMFELHPIWDVPIYPYSFGNKLYFDDFTNDGVTDVLSRFDSEISQLSGTTGWGLHVNDGTQLFGQSWGEFETDHAELLGKADLNGDGWLDLLSFDRTTGDLLASVNSREGFQTQRWGNLTTVADWTHLMLDDFDGDGDADLLAGEPNGTWWLARNDGSRFRNEFWGRFPNHNWTDVVVGQFAGDGLPDVAALAPDETWWLWEGTKEGLSKARYWGHWKMQSDWLDIQVGDFNNDQLDDLIGRSNDGGLWVGTSAGERFQTWRWGTGWVERGGWTNVTLVDVNADGLLDQVGKSKDDLWWYAENLGAKFRNSLWGERTHRRAHLVQNFILDEAIDVRDKLPAGGVMAEDLNLRFSVNEDNRLEFTASDTTVVSFDLKSATGALIPAAGGLFESRRGNLVSDASEQRITLSPNKLFDGTTTLSASWDPSKGQDLVANVTLLSGEIQVPAEPPLGSGKGLSTAAKNRLYHGDIHGELHLTRGWAYGDWSDAPDAPVGDLVVGVEGNELYLQGEGLEVTALDFVSEAEVILRRPWPLYSFEPFDWGFYRAYEVNYGNSDNVPTLIDGRIELDARLDPNAAINDLVIRYRDGEGQTFRPQLTEELANWVPGNFEDEPSSPDSPTEELESQVPIEEVENPDVDPPALEMPNEPQPLVPVVTPPSTPVEPDPVVPVEPPDVPPVPETPIGDVVLSLNEQSKLVLSGTASIFVFEARSPNGSLITADSYPPFQFVLSNTPQLVSAGVLGTPIVIDGSLTLDLGWDADADASDLQFQYGIGAQVFSAELDDSFDRIDSN